MFLIAVSVFLSAVSLILLISICAYLAGYFDNNDDKKE